MTRNVGRGFGRAFHSLTRPAALIRRGRGILKRTPGARPLKEDWAEHKERERALEERHAG